MSATPNARTPGEHPKTTETVTVENVDVSSTGVTEIGSVVTDQAEVKEVRINTTDQDFDFNVAAEGTDVFSSEQSPSSAEESFVPDQNARVGGTGAVELNFDVSNNSAAGSPQTDVAVVVTYLVPQ